MKKIKVGWIGSGFVGQAAHLERFIRFENSEVVALAEIRPKLRKMVGKSFGIPHLYDHHTKLLEESDCEAVVAVVHRRHAYDVAKDVLLSGRHILIEKPMVENYDQAKDLVELAKNRSLCFCVGFMRRYDDGVCIFKKKLDEFRKNNELGEIISFRIFVEASNDYCGIFPRLMTKEVKPDAPPVNIAPKWVPEKYKISYEQFVNVCAHDINLMRFLLDEIPNIANVNYRKDKFSYVNLEFKDFFGILEWGFRPDDVDGWNEGVEIRFQHGEMTLTMPPAFLKDTSSTVRIRKNSSNVTKRRQIILIDGNYSWAFENSDRAFVENIHTNKKAFTSGELCLDDYIIIDEIWRNIV